VPFLRVYRHRRISPLREIGSLVFSRTLPSPATTIPNPNYKNTHRLLNPLRRQLTRTLTHFSHTPTLTLTLTHEREREHILSIAPCKCDSGRCVSRGLGWRIHGSVEDTKLSTNKQHTLSPDGVVVYCCCLLLFITAGPSTKLFRWGEGNSGGHVL